MREVERREGEVRRGMGKEEGVRGEGEEEKGMVVGERFETTVSYAPPPQDFLWHTVPCTCKGTIPFGVWEVRIVTS